MNTAVRTNPDSYVSTRTASDTTRAIENSIARTVTVGQQVVFLPGLGVMMMDRRIVVSADDATELERLRKASDNCSCSTCPEIAEYASLLQTLQDEHNARQISLSAQST